MAALDASPVDKYQGVNETTNPEQGSIRQSRPHPHAANRAVIMGAVAGQRAVPYAGSGTRDFFVCDFLGAMPKHDLASMEHPIFSLSTRPDRRILSYHHNDAETVQIIQSPYQKIEFYLNLERHNDTCFMLDGGEIN